MLPEIFQRRKNILWLNDVLLQCLGPFFFFILPSFSPPAPDNLLPITAGFGFKSCTTFNGSRETGYNTHAACFDRYLVVYRISRVPIPRLLLDVLVVIDGIAWVMRPITAHEDCLSVLPTRTCPLRDRFGMFSGAAARTLFLKSLRVT